MGPITKIELRVLDEKNSIKGIEDKNYIFWVKIKMIILLI